ncbi:hypothetical protein LOTGIDRAFT_238085 [Lottia gigantea]|uniref:C2H2-type domain-containing protein n=1 Tax=Lottia gigantea TaxID=225164 RepID=V4AD31_LOTGI|nr:hypothetical protein LOTGIDRAFT_238085 [Lottia gigantea]ESP01894.1 hypothetical protein LOTGIDRAFT_238085 [Lottia gigantea]
MSVFTCITCRVAFADAELQRSHYKTDWHRYNLKRKVAELPPVTAENFNSRVLAQKSQVEESEKNTVSQCLICKKKFNSENAYKTHVKSIKHQEAEKNYDPETEENKKNKAISRSDSQAGSSKGDNSQQSTDAAISSQSPDAEMSDDDDEEGSEVESWNSDDVESLPIEECLFCSVIGDSLEDNVKHMTEEHSFFIPDAEYLVNLEGLISYLGEKVGVANMCLWCNTKGRSFYSKQAAKNHMVDKGHSKMLHEGEAVFEYSDFYDYRKSYPDHEGKTDEEEEMEIDTPDLVGEGFELVLPSGATIGHRSLARYYKQKLRHETHRPQHRAIMPGILSQYRALGWTGATGPMVEQKKKDIMYMQKLRNKHFVQVGVKGNKLYRNYKPQNPI